MEFPTVNKTFVKSHNNVYHIYRNYTYSLLGIIVITILLYLIFGYQSLILPLVKTIVIAFVISSIIGYILNLTKKDYCFINIYKKDHVHLIGIIIGLFSVNVNLIILAIAITLSLIINKYIKGINLSAALYGILIIIIYKYYASGELSTIINIKSPLTSEELIGDKINLRSYLIGINYLSPIPLLLGYIYLFHKKSIKYNIFTSYMLTFIFIMLIYGIIKDMSLWLIIYEITYANFMLCSIYLLNDYCITPSIAEGQILYGISLGIISAILRFIIPELAIIITLILGPIIFTKLFENLSPKFKAHKKSYNLSFIIAICLILLTTVGLIIVF